MMRADRVVCRRDARDPQDGEVGLQAPDTPPTGKLDEPVEEWLPLVRRVLYRLLPAHARARADAEDLYQAGVVGLLNARRLYDPRRGVKFITYATHKIRWAMLIEAGLTRHGWPPQPERLEEK